MNITIDDQLLSGVELTPQEARVDLAAGLYASRRATLGRAARIAGLSLPAFIKELGLRQIPMNYDVAELQADLQTLREHPLR